MEQSLSHQALKPSNQEESVANHLTPIELAELVKLERSDVIARCIQYGVPMYQGKIDKTLFVAAMNHEEQAQEQDLAQASS